MIFSAERRQALRKMFLGASLGLMFAVGVSYPRRAEAFVWEIPSAVIEFHDITVGYYKNHIEKYVEKAKELIRIFDDESPLISSILTATDAANLVRNKIEESRLKRESQPPPSDQCAAENVDKGAETMAGVADLFSFERASSNAKELALIFKENRGFSSQRNIENHLNEQINKMPLIEALESLEAANFVGSEGYLDPENMSQFINSLLAKARLQLSTTVTRNFEGVTDGATYISRMSAAEDALTQIYTRRIPSETFYQDIHGNGLPYERDIIERIKRPLGMSVVDQERFEIERTHLSKVWQDEVEENTSATSLSKEINFQQAFSNHLDARIAEFNEQLGILKSLSTLTELDTTSKHDYETLMEHFELTKGGL